MPTMLNKDHFHAIFPLELLSPAKGGPTDLSAIPVKDVLIVLFMLGLWLYSIMLIVRAWAKVHHVEGGGEKWTGQSTIHIDCRYSL